MSHSYTFKNSDNYYLLITQLLFYKQINVKCFSVCVNCYIKCAYLGSKLQLHSGTLELK